MQRFDSARRLLPFLAVVLKIAACADPVEPPPEAAPIGIPRWSTATHVLWSGPDARSTAPLAVFVDVAGGPLDRIAADSQVATFLNDRFQPFFVVPTAAPGLVPDPPGALFLDRLGCVRDGPFLPRDPAEWIAHGNAVLIALAQGERSARRLPKVAFSFPLAVDHPLRGQCRSQG